MPPGRTPLHDEAFKHVWGRADLDFIVREFDEDARKRGFAHAFRHSGEELLFADLLRAAFLKLFTELNEINDSAVLLSNIERKRDGFREEILSKTPRLGELLRESLSTANQSPLSTLLEHAYVDIERRAAFACLKALTDLAIFVKAHLAK